MVSPSAPIPTEPLGLGLFVLVGLLGGAHCLGMCGPLVTVYAERLADSEPGIRPFAVQQLLLFNLGRAIAYATLGAIFGGLGALAVDAASVVAIVDPVRAVAGIGAGVLIIGAGGGYLLTGRSPIGHDIPIFGRLFGHISSTLSERINHWVDGPGILALGALHGLLPCPLLYPAFLYALVMGSPGHGALALGALGLGTIPPLFVYGTLIRAVSTDSRQTLHRGLGLAFIGLGYIPLSMGLAILGIDVPMIPLPMVDPIT